MYIKYVFCLFNNGIISKTDFMFTLSTQDINLSCSRYIYTPVVFRSV